MKVKLLNLIGGAALLAGAPIMPVTPAAAAPTRCMLDARAYADSQAPRDTPEWDEAYYAYMDITCNGGGTTGTPGGPGQPPIPTPPPCGYMGSTVGCPPGYPLPWMDY